MAPRNATFMIMQVWPNTGLHFASVAKLASLLGKDDMALQASQAAIDILKITHPDGDSLNEQLQMRHALLNEVSAAPHHEQEV